MKYVLVSGGVISGIGKGVIASSTGLLLKTMGFKVSAIKIDPYMNVDAGTMSPTEHGEVFVLNDGGEVDLDLGNYERFLHITLSKDNNITTGKIYQHVIEKEVRASIELFEAEFLMANSLFQQRRGDYLGKTVQIVPHLTDAIQEWIQRVARIPVDATNEEPDICILELGGTVGDIESAPFIEALRQLRRNVGRGNFLQIHVSLVPIVAGEQKTKPTQQAIRDVRSAGLMPDLIACRCIKPLEKATINKTSLFCDVEPERVIAVHDVASTYHVPLLLEKQNLPRLLTEILNLNSISPSADLVRKGQEIWKEWKTLTIAQERLFDEVKVALVGKYTGLHDSYLSVVKSLEHSAMKCGRKLKLMWVDSELLEEKNHDSAQFHKAWHDVCTADGILVPGGFGIRGTEGMIKAAKWARTKGTPFLGICLGMQLAVIEYARNICNIGVAQSEEMKVEGAENVIIFMPEGSKTHLGGTMRLGIRPTIFQPGSEWSRVRRLYGDKSQILERHRHRYEVNPEYVERLEHAGLNFVGKDDTSMRMEVVELKDHPYYVGVQFHPEYLSRVLEPSKPYLGFIAACAGILDEILEEISPTVGAAKKDAAVISAAANAETSNQKNDIPFANGILSPA